MDTARSNALAYRIWAYASPSGWDCSVAEIASALQVGTKTVANIAYARGWRNRLRQTSLNTYDKPFAGYDPTNLSGNYFAQLAYGEQGTHYDD